MDKATNDKARETAPLPAKKPYKAPSFRFQSVFEISALACGKMQTTQSSCAHSRKAS
jgi:hypothetical protein